MPFFNYPFPTFSWVEGNPYNMMSIISGIIFVKTKKIQVIQQLQHKSTID